MNRTIVAIFESAQDAEAARQELIDVAIPREDIHLRGGTGAAGRDDDDRSVFWRRVLGSTDAADEAYGHYAEAERRGNAALVIEDVEQREAASIETTLAAHGVVDIDTLAEDWRTRGWRGYDERAPALTPAELDEERRLSARSRAGGASGIDARRCVRVYSVVVTGSSPGAGSDRPGSAR